MFFTQSNIVNWPTGYTVQRQDIIGNMANDLYTRFLVEESILPCIYAGLQVTHESLLTINVSAGRARGKDIGFMSSLLPYDAFPTVVGLATDVQIDCPDNTTSAIVLQINCLPDPNTVADAYVISTANDGMTSQAIPTAIDPADINIGPNTTFPYSMVLLAFVTTSGGVVTNINAIPNAIEGTRSFDWSMVLPQFNSAYYSLIQTGMAIPFFGISTYVPIGFILWDDGTIGNTGSIATNTAGQEVFNLYSLLWNSTTNTECQLYDPLGTPIPRGTSASDDFSTNNVLALPRGQGMTVGNAGAASTAGGITTSDRVLGQAYGEEEHILIVDEMPSHDHGVPFGDEGGGTTAAVLGNETITINTDTTGGGGGHNTIQPTTWLTWIIKL